MLGSYEDETVKVIIVGDGFTGKTSLLRRFVRGDFTDQYRKTIGAEFLEKDVFLRESNATVKLMLWDTAGQEVFNALTQAYYRGAGAAVLVFSTVDRESFVNVSSWKERVEAVCGPITMVLCQSKFDLSHEAAIANEEAEGLARALKLPLYRVSSKDDFNVTQLFEFTAHQCLSGSGEADKEDEGNNSSLEAAPPPRMPLQEEGASASASPANVAVPTQPQEPAAASTTVNEACRSEPAPAAPSPAGATTTATDAPTRLPATTGTTAPVAAAPPTSGKVSSSADPDAAAKRTHTDDPRKVSLTEPEAVMAADGKKKKKKRRCTLL